MVWHDAPDGKYGNYIWNNELANRMFYRPCSEEIKTAFFDFKKEHPHIMITDKDIDKIRITSQKNDEYKRWLDYLRKEALLLLEEPTEDFADPTWSMLFHVRHVKDRAEILGLIYLIDEDERFAKRLWQEINAVLDIDWTKEHYLITAEICFAASITYDWLYNYLDKGSLSHLKKAIWSKALFPALDCYKEANGIGPDFLNHLDKTGWWSRCSGNWNMVCNGCFICSALALADTNEESFDIIEYALKGLPYTILQYLPDGGSEESVGYWKYAYSYFCRAMCALETSLGTEYGYFKQPLMKQTIAFPIALTGPCGTFNFHDSGIEPVADICEMFFFAGRLNMPDIRDFRTKLLTEKEAAPTIYDIIWYYDNPSDGASFPCDWYFRASETVSMRSSWDKDAFAVGFHTGNNDACHSHLDMGSLIVDYLGERWLCDLGNEQLTYSPKGKDINRWDLYRMRAEGHNTLVLNPGTGPDQKIDAHCRISNYSFDTYTSSVSADLSAACDIKDAKWQRSLTLDKKNCVLTICDTFKSNNSNELYWFAHTRAQCNITHDGKRVILIQNGKQIVLELLSPADTKFLLMEANPLATSPVVAGQEDNIGVTKIAIHLSNVKACDIVVTIKQHEE